MRCIRQLLGLGVGLIERLAKADQPRQTLPGLSLYYFRACPFCINVRLAMHRRKLAVEWRDIDAVPAYRAELIRLGGKAQVPCLRIESESGVRWLYESGAIIAWLDQTASIATPAA